MGGPFKNIGSDPPVLNDLDENYLQRQLYLFNEEGISDDLKLDFPATEEEAMEEEKPKGKLPFSRRSRAIAGPSTAT